MNVVSDQMFMSLAIEEGRKARFWSTPNPPVGCILVRYGQVIGSGFTQPRGQHHAEIEALRSCEEPFNATAYVTLEPCSHYGNTPPCTKALIAAGIARVVVAIEDPNPAISGQGILQLREAGIEVELGVLADEVEESLKGFLMRMRRGWGRITLKIAASFDGRNAMASGESQWITGPEARRDVQLFRAESDLIVVGIGSVLSDDCRLSVRASELPLPEDDRARAMIKPPHKMVLDSKGRISPQARVLYGGETIIITTVPAFLPEDIKVVEVPANPHGRVDLSAWAHYLGETQYNDIFVEAGSVLSGSLIRGGWVDRLILYQAPRFLGHSARPISDFCIDALCQSPNFKVDEVKLMGSDIRIIATTVK